TLQINRGSIVNFIERVLTTDKFADLVQAILNPGSAVALASEHATPRKSSLARGYSGTQLFNTFGSSSEVGEPNHCGIPGGASQWFAYQAEADGQLIVNTDGSSFDTVLAVYTGSGADFESLLPVTCDNNSGLDGRNSSVVFTATRGVVYYIAIDGVNGATG